MTIWAAPSAAPQYNRHGDRGARAVGWRAERGRVGSSVLLQRAPIWGDKILSASRRIAQVNSEPLCPDLAMPTVYRSVRRARSSQADRSRSPMAGWCISSPSFARLSAAAQCGSSGCFAPVGGAIIRNIARFFERGVLAPVRLRRGSSLRQNGGSFGVE